MSNRKFAAALLEGGSFTEDDRMKANLEIIKPKIQEMIEYLFKEHDVNVHSHDIASKTIHDIAQTKLDELSPELGNKYEILIGQSQNFDNPMRPWSVYMGYRIKEEWRRNKMTREWADYANYNPFHIHASDISAGTINATRITASSIGTSSIQTATIGNLDASHIGRVAPLTPNQVRERYGMGVLNTDGVAIARNIEFANDWGTTGTQRMLLRRDDE